MILVVLIPAAALASESLPSDAQATRIMYALSDSPSVKAQAAIDTILAARDSRFVAVFVELVHAARNDLVKNVGYKTHVRALERLSGQKFGVYWPAWVEWYGATNLAPPPGFTGWKGQLLARIDPGFGDFLTDDASSRIRVEEIQWGGVGVDGIPALTNPRMIPAPAATYLGSKEPVFGISINGDSRAYPLRILDCHEMANDVVGGVPVSFAYCTLCGAGIAYDGRASDGATYTFGSSGLLFRSNKLMYDHQTRTLWNQLTGEPVLGKLAARDVKLTLLPAVLTTWAEWQAQHPDSRVVDMDTGYDLPYVPGAFYGDYFSSPDTMFPVWRRSKVLPTKARVYTLHLDGVPKAYPVKTLTAKQVVNDRVGKTPVVLIARRGMVKVRGNSQRIGEVIYDAGGEVRAYRRGQEGFRPGPDANTVLDSAGRLWQITEEALVGPSGERAPRINGFLAYWFGWYSFFPQTLVYQP